MKQKHQSKNIFNFSKADFTFTLPHIWKLVEPVRGAMERDRELGVSATKVLRVPDTDQSKARADPTRWSVARGE